MPAKINKFRKPVDRVLLFVVVTLIGVGLVAVFSASAVLSFERFGNNYYYIVRQLVFAALGLLLILIFSRLDYHLWKKWSFPILLSGIGLLVAVLVPSLGFKVGNARSWFNLGWFLAQPSELIKLAVIFYLSSWFERKIEPEKNFWFGVIPPLFFVGLPVGLIALEPDIGTAMILCIIIFVMLFATGARVRYLITLFAGASAATWFLIRSAPYRAARIITFLDPSLDPKGIGYHINQALLAVGSGGFWGYGFGASRQKHNYLPEPIGDSIFAVMAEELGFIRVAIVVLLFLVLAMQGLSLAKKAPDKFGQLVVIGITSWLVLQALVNIGAIIGLLPFTGITLPFMSYGGSSMIATCIGIGVLLNISRQRL